MALLVPIRDDMHHLHRHALWIAHHGMELDLELQELQTLWTLNAAGTRQVMELRRDATHDACSSGELPDYGGKGACIALVGSFAKNSQLGKGRASFYLECFWGKVIVHGHRRPNERNLAWWTVNWCGDFSRSVVRGLGIFILLLYGLCCRLVLSIVFIQMYVHSFDFLVRLVLSIVFCPLFLFKCIFILLTSSFDLFCQLFLFKCIFIQSHAVRSLLPPADFAWLPSLERSS